MHLILADISVAALGLIYALLGYAVVRTLRSSWVITA